jgi:hypothetical protein
MSMRISVLSIGRLQASDFASLVQRIGQENFDSSRNSGFLISRQKSSLVEGRYVHKVNSVIKVVDPLGGTLEFPRVAFFEQRFQLQLKSPQLVLFDPSSSWQSLLGRLLEFSDFTISAEPISLTLKSLVKELSGEFTNVRVYGANVEALQINEQTIAKVSIESSADARLEAKAFLKSRQFDFSSLKCEFEHGSRVRRCELRANGSLTVYGNCDPLLETAFTKMLSRLCAEVKPA